MQTTTNPGIANPVLHEASTLGASFWMVLASTTGVAATPGSSREAFTTATAQDSPSPATNGGQETEQNTAGEASATQANGTTASQNLLPPPAAFSPGGSGVTGTAILAQRIMSAVTEQSALRSPGRVQGKSDSSPSWVPPAAAVQVPTATLSLNTGVALPPPNAAPLNSPMSGQGSGSAYVALHSTTIDSATVATAIPPTTSMTIEAPPAETASSQGGTLISPEPQKSGPDAPQSATSNADPAKQVSTQPSQGQAGNPVVAGRGRVNAEPMTPAQTASAVLAIRADAAATAGSTLHTTDDAMAGNSESSILNAAAIAASASNAQPASTPPDHSVDRSIAALASIGAASSEKVQDASPGSAGAAATAAADPSQNASGQPAA
ncbi:MAG: hypothetical protein WBD46_05895, partial [Acidobacteriaceae bacterium]